jgi:hypothetical protein
MADLEKRDEAKRQVVEQARKGIFWKLIAQEKLVNKGKDMWNPNHDMDYYFDMLQQSVLELEEQLEEEDKEEKEEEEPSVLRFEL